MAVLPYVISEVFSEGEVPEQFYDDKMFLLDRDHRGEVWRLKIIADHLTRYKVLYHPTVIEKKNDDIRLCLEAKTTKEMKAYDDARDLFEINKDCEVKLRESIRETLNNDEVDDEPSLTLSTLGIFDKLKVPILKAFYCCQLQEYLTDKINIPNKRNMTNVCGGETDRKTNGPLLIQLCFDVKSLSVCAKNPQLSQPESGII